MLCMDIGCPILISESGASFHSALGDHPKEASFVRFWKDVLVLAKQRGGNSSIEHSGLKGIAPKINDIFHAPITAAWNELSREPPYSTPLLELRMSSFLTAQVLGQERNSGLIMSGMGMGMGRV